MALHRLRCLQDCTQLGIMGVTSGTPSNAIAGASSTPASAVTDSAAPQAAAERSGDAPVLVRNGGISKRGSSSLPPSGAPRSGSRQNTTRRKPSSTVDALSWAVDQWKAEKQRDHAEILSTLQDSHSGGNDSEAVRQIVMLIPGLWNNGLLLSDDSHPVS